MSRRNQQRQASSVRVASRGVWILGIVVIAAIGGIVHSYRSRRAEILLLPCKRFHQAGQWAVRPRIQEVRPACQLFVPNCIRAVTYVTTYHPKGSNLVGKTK